MKKILLTSLLTASALSAQISEVDVDFLNSSMAEINPNSNSGDNSYLEEDLYEGMLLAEMFGAWQHIDLDGNGIVSGASEVAAFYTFVDGHGTAYGAESQAGYIGEAYNSTAFLNDTGARYNNLTNTFDTVDYTLGNTNAATASAAFKDYDTILGNMYDAGDENAGGAPSADFIFTNNDGGNWESNLTNFNANADGDTNTATLADALFSFDDAIGDLQGNHLNSNVDPDATFTQDFYEVIGALGGEYGNGQHTGFYNADDNSSVTAILQDFDQTMGPLQDYTMDINNINVSSAPPSYYTQINNYLGSTLANLENSPFIHGNATSYTGFSETGHNGFFNTANLDGSLSFISSAEIMLGLDQAVGGWTERFLNSPTLVAGNLLPVSELMQNGGIFNAADMNFTITDSIYLINESFGDIQTQTYENISNINSDAAYGYGTPGSNPTTTVANMFGDVDDTIGDWAGTINDGSNNQLLTNVGANDSIAAAIANLDAAISNAGGGAVAAVGSLSGNHAINQAPLEDADYYWIPSVVGSNVYQTETGNPADTGFFNIADNSTVTSALGGLDDVIGDFQGHLDHFDDQFSFVDSNDPFLNAGNAENITDVLVGIDYHLGDVNAASDQWLNMDTAEDMGVITALQAGSTSIRLTNAVQSIDNTVGDFSELFAPGGVFDGVTIDNADGQAGGTSITDVLAHLSENTGASSVVIPAGTYNVLDDAGGQTIDAAAIALDGAFGDFSGNYTNFNGGASVADVFAEIDAAITNAAPTTATMPTAGNYYAMGSTVTDAVAAVDAQVSTNATNLGDMGFATATNITDGTDVTGALLELDAAIAGATSGSTTNTAAITNLEDNVLGDWLGDTAGGLDNISGFTAGGTMTDAIIGINNELGNIAANAVDIATVDSAITAAVGTNDYSNTYNATTATNATDAITSLDSAMGDVLSLNSGGHYYAAGTTDMVTALTEMDQNINTAFSNVQSQLDTFDTQIARQNNRINNNTNKINALDSRVSKAIAMTSALDFTAAPCCKSSRIFFGGSSYDGEVGYGIGYSYNMNDTFDISVGYASGGGMPLDDDVETMFKGQVGYSW